MTFRTEIEIKPDCAHRISHEDGIVMLGSCFTDNVGSRMEQDGFEVIHNPMGPLYNPVSLAQLLERLHCGCAYHTADMVVDENGAWHCLDFASRYSSADPYLLVDKINCELDILISKFKTATTAIITLGSAFVYKFLPTSKIIGNCHKLQASSFLRWMLSPEDCRDSILQIIKNLPSNFRNVIFTVSPIRHIGDGLHGNQVSKANLMLSYEQAMACINDSRVSYFPSYEIMMDDLRDYRFYTSDMKHPSETAIDYIYDKFGTAYFSKDTLAKASKYKKEWLRSQHRPINPQ